MLPTRRSEKWLLILWSSGGRDVVNLKSVISPISEAKVGTVVFADKGNGSHEAATVIGYSHNRQTLERHICLKTKPKEEQQEEEAQTAQEPGDNDKAKELSVSASDWKPIDEHPSSDEEEVEQKKIKLERFSRSYSRKDNKPSHRAAPVNVVIAKNRKRKILDGQIEGETSNITNQRSPDSTNISPVPGPSDIVSIKIQDIMEMKQCFKQIFSIIRKLKFFAYPKHRVDWDISHSMQQVVTPISNNTIHEDIIEDECDMSNRSEDLNRSDDNVLITNKYDTPNSKILTEHDKHQNKNTDEYIPIGSGKTKIHEDMYRKVNWISYSYATRTLLLALFPRRVLATHSLTGKRSPAFQDKPAKMCLDPKKVSDVIMEVTNRFKVKESHVRAIITTKCADECKMYKNRQDKKMDSLPAAANKENADVDEEDNEANTTC